MGKQIMIALVVGAIGAGAGVLLGKTLYGKDPTWIQKQIDDAKKQATIDAEARTQQAVTGARDAAYKEGFGAAKTGLLAKITDATLRARVDAILEPPKEAGPPAGWAPGVVTFLVPDFGISRVSFTSEAPVETIVGTTTKVSGPVTVDLSDISKLAQSEITVDLRTLKTGNDTRDGHLQGEQWLDTEKNPFAVFKLERVESAAANKGLWPGRLLSVTVHGTLTLRGVSKPATADVEVSFNRTTAALKEVHVLDDFLRIKVHFRVKIADFGITKPPIIGKKVSETVDRNLDLPAIKAAAAKPAGDAKPE